MKHLIFIIMMFQHIALVNIWEIMVVIQLPLEALSLYFDSKGIESDRKEVLLKHAEDLALKHTLITTDDDYAILDSDKFKEFFSLNTLFKTIFSKNFVGLKEDQGKCSLVKK